MIEPMKEKRLALQAQLEAEPNNAKLWLEYGEFVEREYEFPDEVVRAFENAAKAAPKADLRARLGRALVMAGRRDEGISMMTESLTENPRALSLIHI